MKILKLLPLLLILSSCTSFKEKVGLVKDQPDEYQVVSNPPLSVPADLANAPSPEEAAANKKSSIPVNNANLSKGENILLQNLNK